MSQNDVMSQHALLLHFLPYSFVKPNMASLPQHALPVHLQLLFITQPCSNVIGYWIQLDMNIHIVDCDVYSFSSNSVTSEPSQSHLIGWLTKTYPRMQCLWLKITQPSWEAILMFIGSALVIGCDEHLSQSNLISQLMKTYPRVLCLWLKITFHHLGKLFRCLPFLLLHNCHESQWIFIWQFCCYMIAYHESRWIFIWTCVGNTE